MTSPFPPDLSAAVTQALKSRAKSFTPPAVDSNLPGENLTCEWTEDDDGSFDTTCENKFEFTWDGPKKNGFKFCPYCGEPLKEVRS